MGAHAQTLQAQLDFENVLSGISARFVTASTTELPSVIDDALARICDCLDCDIAAVWQWSPERHGAYVMTNVYRRFDGPPVPEFFDARDYFPWTMRRNEAGETVVFKSRAEVPAEAARDLESWTYFEVRSCLNYPLSVAGNRVLGTFALCTVREERAWSETIVTRLRLVAEMCANALARARAEEALRASEARLALAAESANTGLWSWDAESNSIWITETTGQLFGVSARHELPYAEFIALVHRDDRAKVEDAIQRAMRTLTEYRVTYRIVLRDNDVRWVEAVGRPRYTPSGQPSGLMGVLLDNTQRKRREAEIESLRRDLAHVARVSLLGELAASLGHELSQPLHAIMHNTAAATMLLANAPAEIKEILADIDRDARRATKVIERIRDMGKRSALRVEPLDANELVAEVADLVHSNVIDNKVDLRWIPSDAPSVVHGDRVHLQQAVLNLLLNAIDAMKQSATRTLTLAIVALPGEVEIRVSDTGPGIDDQQKEAIFVPFVSTKTNGVGLGLPITQSIIQAHDGRISVENNPGGGSTFVIALPTSNATTSHDRVRPA